MAITHRLASLIQDVVWAMSCEICKFAYPISKERAAFLPFLAVPIFRHLHPALGLGTLGEIMDGHYTNHYL